MYTITDEEFNQLVAFIQQNYGIHLKEEKRTLITGRLHSLLSQNSLKSFSEYYDFIQADRSGEAMSALINRITTNHTFFMRESDHFCFFRDNVLSCLKSISKDRDLRIWSAGCSSGEEPYTLAMVVDEVLGKEKLWWDTKILATDISDRVLEKARKGKYGHENITPLPSHWKLNYFKRYDHEHYILMDRIKDEVIFRKFNLMDEVFPFKKKFHAIFCRNVMIYFNAQTRRELVNKFYEATENGGYLFIGHSETLNRDETRYKYVMPAVYRKE